MVKKASVTLSSDSTPSIVEKQGQSDVQVANQRFKRIQEEQKQQEDELKQRYVELSTRTETKRGRVTKKSC